MHKINLIICPPFWNKMPPLGLALLYSYLKAYKISVKVYDLNIELFHKSLPEIQKIWLSNVPEHKKKINDYLKENFSDFFLDYKEKLSCQNVINCFSLFECNKDISIWFSKKLNTKIVFGGPEVLYELNRGNKDPFKNIADIAVLGECDAFVSFLVPKNITLMQDIPISFDCFSLSLYTRSGFLPLLFSQGCVNKCRFCVERLLTKGFSCRGAEIVVLEIENYIKKYNVKNFIFHDSLINADLKELELFCDLIIEKNIKIKWETQCYIKSSIKESLLLKMKKSGCYNLFIGVENFSNKVLDYMNKGYGQKDIIVFLEKLKKAGLHCELSMIVGVKAEGEKEFKENLDFIKKYKGIIPKIAQINKLQVLPGTDIEPIEEKVSYERIKKLINLLEQEKIRYTKAFINNL